MASAHDDGDTRSAMVELAADTALRAEKARQGNGAMSASGRRWPSFGARTRDVEALAAHERHAANSFYVGQPWQH